MKTIGITGGVGAGKSEVLKYIANNYNCTIITADKLAYELECPGRECYKPIVELLGNEILDKNGFINKSKMAEKIFADASIVSQVNAIIHPAVKRNILQQIEDEKKKGIIDFFFVEAALLIEEGYEHILDELWYISASEEIRRERLKSSRGYSDEKIDYILANQLSDDEFRRHCKTIIDNSFSLSETCKQIDEALK